MTFISRNPLLLWSSWHSLGNSMQVLEESGSNCDQSHLSSLNRQNSFLSVYLNCTHAHICYMRIMSYRIYSQRVTNKMVSLLCLWCSKKITAESKTKFMALNPQFLGFSLFSRTKHASSWGTGFESWIVSIVDIISDYGQVT